MQASRAEFGQKLKAWREDQRPRLSQERLAGKWGCSTQTISRWERGLHDVERDEDAARLEKLLGIEVPRPARTAAAKLDLGDQLSALTERVSTVEERLLAMERRDALRAGASVDLPSPDGQLDPSDLGALTEAAARPARDRPRRRRPGPPRA
jgi:transcriptional regulator with XRE-family HTH domain